MNPEKIGRYQIKSELGQGGMATVYQGYDPSFERDVAIKVLPPALLHDPQFRVRFDREAKMIASLEHPAIVPVYDFGEQDGQPFIVMRFMAGGSLSGRIKKKPLSPEETARIITRLAPALDAAHSQGIIHRDLKPGNVLFDQYGNAFLSDFGIARLTEAGSATLTGESIVGTPAYMSPEQVQGEKAIDGRSDIYSLGVLIFQMLTGQAPYQADTQAKVMMMHLLEPVPRIREKRGDLPPGVDPVISRAMAKDPQSRFDSTQALAKALESAVLEAGEQEDTLVLDQSHDTLASAPATLTSSRTAQSPSAATTAPTPRPGVLTARKPRSAFSIALILLVILGGGALAAGGLIYFGGQGSGPLAMLAPAGPTHTSSPTVTSSPPSKTPPPTHSTPAPVAAEPTSAPTERSQESTGSTPPTPSPTLNSTPLPQAPVIGGADKIAFINRNDIWSANLDGSDLVQLTHDGGEKFNLQWTPDGRALKYILGKCVHLAEPESGSVERLACFNFADSLKAFEISPDGSRVAISVDNQLYLTPYDPGALSDVQSHSDLTEIARCKNLAPYERNFVTQARWSKDGNQLAIKILGVLEDGRRADIIQVLEVDNCTSKPHILDNFPPPRFTFSEYEKNPTIQNFAWDGDLLFAFTSLIRNDGFGDLYLYNTELYKDYPKVNPIQDTCCYRDPRWGPDFSYITFAFQDYRQGADSATSLYYVPFGSLGTGASFEPLPLPEISDPREKPYPALRPAQ
jgi:serine/threonine protein kinase